MRSCVMKCGVEHAVHPTKGNAQQRRCWGCGEVGHCLWACPKKAVHLREGNTQKKVVGRTEVEEMIKEVKCVKCGRKGMNTVFIPISIARGKMCPGCEKGKGRSINAACPEGGKVQLSRSWWGEEEVSQMVTYLVCD